ncbi:M48 family metalloprotease [Streptomyces seoulensis]
MTYALILVVAALAFPWGAAPVARRLAAGLRPREACWALASAAVLMAGGTIAALIGLFQVPFLASLQHVSLPRVLAVWPAAVPVACAAALIMTVQAVLLVRRWARHRSLLGEAWLSAAGGAGDGDLLMLPDEDVDAFALPGHRGRPGRIVVTAGMARALEPVERAALLAHERAHLSGRHHFLSLLTDLGATVHPAVRGLRGPLDFHLERWADEEAAAAVGDRKAVATAVARAALAGAARPRGAGGGYPRLSVASGPVPRRVEALLLPEPAAPRGGARRAGAVGLAATVAVSALAALALAYGLHEYVEYAAVAVRGR